MNVALRLPESLGMSLKEFSKYEKISMNQFIATAIAEKMSTLKTYDYLEEKAKNGNATHLKSMLAKVPDTDWFFIQPEFSFKGYPKSILVSNRLWLKMAIKEKIL